MNMPQISKTKCIVNFRNIKKQIEIYRRRKKFWFGGIKMAKSNKIEKTEELILGYQEAECVVFVAQRQKLTAKTKENV